jgi:5-methylcytosine-specific restriction protein A
MYDVHHRKPRRMGGTSRRSINSPENLLLLCRACHNRAEQHREWAYAYGLLVHDWAQPEDVPVMVHGYPNPVWLRGGEYKPSPQEVPGG